MPAFANFKSHFGVVFEHFANPDKSAAVFFDVAGEVKSLGNKFLLSNKLAGKGWKEINHG